MLSGSREPDSITPEERDMVQSLINETYGKFKSVVASGRKWAQEKNKDKGRALSRGLGGLRRWPHPLRHGSLQAGLCG